MSKNIVVNELDLVRAARARSDYFAAFGVLDAKRPEAWSVYGYPDAVPFDKLLAAYERGGAAHGAVHRLLDKCWEARPRIKKPKEDKETAWEKSVSKVFKDAGLWPKLRDLDRRNLIGRYSAIIYRVADGKTLDQPLVNGSQLVDIVPLFEDQIKVTAWHADQADAVNFGKPQMFEYRTHAVPTQGSDTQAQPHTWVRVHPSRVQLLAEGSVGDDFLNGVPLLRAGFNHLIDLEKISGGGAESFLKNSARTLVFKFDANASPQALTQNPDGTPSGKTVADVIQDRARAVNSNQDAAIATQGGDVTTLQTQQSDPTKAFDVAANLFSASVRLPFTVIFGQQTGRLASAEDKADVIARAVSRQINELTPMLEQFVTRMQAIGVFEAGEFEVEWPTLGAPSDDEKFGVLGKATAAMQQAHASGLLEPLFDTNELRGLVGFESRAEDGMPGEGGDSASDPTADPDPSV